MNNRWTHTIAATVLALSATTTLAQERGSKADAQKMVDAALAHVKAVGAEKAFEDFSSPANAADQWHVKDVYLFCYSMSGKNTCHGANKALIGKDLGDLKTADGQPLIKNMASLVSSKGKGWIDYKWPHPQTKVVEDKSAYVAKIPGSDTFLGAGIYR